MKAGVSNRNWVVAAGVLLTLLAFISITPEAGELPETIAAIKPSIVGVGTFQYTRRPPGKFGGTGFVVGDGRHVVTNAHTIPASIGHEDREFLAVLTGRGKGDVRKAKVLSIDRDHDLSLLRIEGDALPTIALGDSEQVREGELYAFTGFPIGMVLGMRPVTHRGIVAAITPIAIPQMSARRLNLKMIRRLNEPYNVFQLDATAYPGNSGSPLYAPDTGKVVGVINKVFVKETKENVLEKPSGITYAIPIKYAKELMRRAGVAFK